jgi:hypothetical protein
MMSLTTMSATSGLMHCDTERPYRPEQPVTESDEALPAKPRNRRRVVAGVGAVVATALLVVAAQRASVARAVVASEAPVASVVAQPH